MFALLDWHPEEEPLDDNDDEKNKASRDYDDFWKSIWHLAKAYLAQRQMFWTVGQDFRSVINRLDTALYIYIGTSARNDELIPIGW